MKSIRRITAFLLALISALSVSACVPTDRVVYTEKEKNSPNFSDTTANRMLDETQLYNDTLEVFENAAPYVFVKDFNIRVDNNEKMLYFHIVVDDEADVDDIERFIAALLRHVNDAASIQMGDVEVSSWRGFGKLYDYFGFYLEVYPESDPENQDKILYGYINEVGQAPDFDSNIEAYEEAWKEEYEYLLKNQVYDINGNPVEQ